MAASGAGFRLAKRVLARNVLSEVTANLSLRVRLEHCIHVAGQIQERNRSAERLFAFGIFSTNADRELRGLASQLWIRCTRFFTCSASDSHRCFGWISPVVQKLLRKNPRIVPLCRSGSGCLAAARFANSGALGESSTGPPPRSTRLIVLPSASAPARSSTFLRQLAGRDYHSLAAIDSLVVRSTMALPFRRLYELDLNALPSRPGGRILTGTSFPTASISA